MPREADVPPLNGHLPYRYSAPSWKDSVSALPSISTIYRDWLFHGPIFQGITNIYTMGADGVAGELRTTALEKCLTEVNGDRWVIDPVLLDSAMQLAGVWARHHLGITVLPTGFKTLHRVGAPTGQEFKAIVWLPEESQNGELHCDLAVYGADGNLILFVETLGGIGSKAFNRLATYQKPLRSK